ncbi:unnamed protein product [Caenorhabditis auriculariae]|uniref:Phosphomevalonate kinase n=1 Tax=Caenorhabditis auriculariae TaxID=2777116 RepID=A0A8S1HMC3_9PELO|nr:unnamed protein product [Caenorhabditis auriculariae]
MVVGISHSLKAEYARIHGLDLEELLSDGGYKEKYRKEMIEWGEQKRAVDPDIFCRAAIADGSSAEVVIVTDCRRQTDMDFFLGGFRTLTVRIESTAEERCRRGFRFTAGIDDAASECGLDDFPFELTVQNSISPDDQLEMIASRAKHLLSNLEDV